MLLQANAKVAEEEKRREKAAEALEKEREERQQGMNEVGETKLFPAFLSPYRPFILCHLMNYSFTPSFSPSFIHLSIHSVIGPLFLALCFSGGEIGESERTRR